MSQLVRRSFDAAFFSRVANDPSVRPWLGGASGADDASPLDFSSLLENPAVVALQAEGGGWVFVPILPGSYEVHTLFLPEGRGAKHMRAAREGFRYMFAETDCLEILTKCPDDNGPARHASSLLGFRERFRREAAWKPGVGISYRAFTLDDWTARDAECLRWGRTFHQALEAAKDLHPAPRPAHVDDEAHDRAVGASILMALASQADKAEGAFNRWAAFAGYAPVRRLSPTLWDVGDGIVELREGELRVAMVRTISPA
ncbi:MAG TPA: hypothetical protein VJQ45_11765 [Ktedonobacterales bacterium]|nr:hypothetical protein [Ktedonobacterales bacterium]